MSGKDIIHIFKGLLPDERLLTDVDMSRITTFRIGGPADIVAEAESPEEIIDLLRTARDNGIPFVVLGNGSNVLVKDKGVRGLVIRINSAMSRAQAEGNTVHAQAGITLGALARFLAAHSLAGFEFASGIPGCLGGGIYMNAGAYNGEIGSLIKEVYFIDENLNLKTLKNEQLDFSYRHCALSGRDVVITGACLELEHGNKEQINELIRDYTRRRRERQPLEYPSAGSMFKRPAGAYAAALIDQAGLKGMRVGDACISQKHAGFFINLGKATAEQMLELVERTKEIVYERSGIMLCPEVRIIGE